MKNITNRYGKDYVIYLKILEIGIIFLILVIVKVSKNKK